MGCLEEMTWLCIACRQRLPARRGALSCIQCGRSHPRGLTCTACRAYTPLIGVVSAGPYRSLLLQRGIHWLKFKRISTVAPHLASLLSPRLAAIAPVAELSASAALVPIPLHPRRQRERGFNQATLLAQALSRATTIPVREALSRQRATYWQSHLPQELRAANVADAFAVREDVRPYTTLLLVDDVTTSGATLSAAARLLALHTRASIWGVTLARG